MFLTFMAFWLRGHGLPIPTPMIDKREGGEQGKGIILACPLFFRKPCCGPLRKVALMRWMLC